VAASWVFADKSSTVATAAFDRICDESAIVPSLWWFEIRNIVIVGERRKRIKEKATRAFLEMMSRLPIRADRNPNESLLFQLCRRYRLSVYDAAYLELAARESAPLATLDKVLAVAAQAEGVPLLG
jgi:predicted nucleic acid-binding protein